MVLRTAWQALEGGGHMPRNRGGGGGEKAGSELTSLKCPTTVRAPVQGLGAVGVLGYPPHKAQDHFS